MKHENSTTEAPTEKPQSTPTQSARRPRRSSDDAGDDADAAPDAAPRRAARSTARRSNASPDDEGTGETPRARAQGGQGRPPKEDRAQRVIRLTAQLDAKLRQLAEFRGVDLNAAASVAIAEDWRRCFGSPLDRT
ncbi:MAG TPA: hypothetical protein VGB85_01655 [Nannocystis sp.]